MLMRIVITAGSDTHVIDHILWYCQAHESHGINMFTGPYIVLDGQYYLWRVHCEPSKYVDYMLLKWSDYMCVY